MGKIKFVTKVKKVFRDKITGNLLNPGDTLIIENDTARLNLCISKGAVELVSVETESDNKGGNPTNVCVNGTEYDLNKVKEALSVIGAAVNANAGYNGVNNKVASLASDQIEALEAELNK
jgi:hypothetical protein